MINEEEIKSGEMLSRVKKSTWLDFTWGPKEILKLPVLFSKALLEAQAMV